MPKTAPIGPMDSGNRSKNRLFDLVKALRRHNNGAGHPWPQGGRGISFDKGQRPGHGARCDHQYNRGREHQTQQAEYEHVLAHIAVYSACHAAVV
jgi:hypothetical protein